MPKRQLSVITGDRVILRLLARGDLPLTLSWRNRDEVRKWFLKRDVISEEGHYKWFDRYQNLDNDFVFLILAKDMNNTPVGQISLYDIDWEAGTAEFGRLLIGEPLASGKGYAKDATKLLLAHGFNVLGLRRIVLEVKDENVPAIAIYRAVGFSEISRENNLIVMTIQKDKFTYIP